MMMLQHHIHFIIPTMLYFSNVHDPYRCDETCERYGNPICMEYSPEAKCYCKKGFVRLKTVGICVTAENRACRAKMPPTEATCARKQNERLSEWLYHEPCANTCANYNVPCNVPVPDGMHWGPHCVCKEGFSRLPNKRCVAIDDPKCEEFWNPTPSTTTPSPTTAQPLLPCKDFCGQSIDVVKTNNVQGTSSEQSNQQHSFYNQPYLAGNYTSNVTYQIGTHAYLHCQVSATIQQLGNRSVSWVRVDNQNIIAVDRESYISSERYQPYLEEKSNQWSLQIKYVEPQDAGLYECQVAVEPKVSARIRLLVSVPVTEIKGDTDRYVKAGSNVTLTCVVSGYIDAPRFIIWYQDAIKILPENYRGSITEEKKSNNTTTISISKLTIPSSKKKDSGNYSCNPTSLESATISLHVINSAESTSAVTSSGCTHGFYVKVYGLFLFIILSCQQT